MREGSGQDCEGSWAERGSQDTFQRRWITNNFCKAFIKFPGRGRAGNITTAWLWDGPVGTSVLYRGLGSSVLPSLLLLPPYFPDCLFLSFYSFLSLVYFPSYYFIVPKHSLTYQYSWGLNSLCP